MIFALTKNLRPFSKFCTYLMFYSCTSTDVGQIFYVFNKFTKPSFENDLKN